MKRKLFVSALILASMLISWTLTAAKPVKIEESMKQIVATYENVEGVDCTVIQKGEGLGILKLMLNKQFGRKFMKGVTSIIMIDYSQASDEVAASVRKSLEVFNGVIHEIEIDEKEIKEGEYIKSYATIKGNTSVSDFILNMEDAESKMLIYMGGELLLDNLDIEF